MQRAPYCQADHWPLWEAAARRAKLVDSFCSSPYWGLAAAHAFHVRSELFVYQSGDDLALFQEYDADGVTMVLPCDTMWCLGSPILAGEPCDFFHRLCDFLTHSKQQPCQLAVGGPFEENPIWESPLWGRYPSREVSAAGRQRASLEGGLDGFLSRRSRNFRSRLRRAVKKAEETAVEVEFWPHQADRKTTWALLERAMAVERQSWKGIANQGIDRGQMLDFYRVMLAKLAVRGGLRGLFLTRGGKDLSYLFGAVFAGYFRGLQFSYLESESDGLGNVGQWKMIERLVEERCQSYDLGQAMGYKSRWAETHIASRARVLLLP